MPARVARVLVDSPLPQLDRLFDYGIPEALEAEALPGVRVRVPLRSAGRVADGFIVEVGDRDTSDGAFVGTLSEIESVVSSVAVLTPEVAQLARKAADRAAGSANDIVRLAVPKRQVRVEKTWVAARELAAAGAAASGAPGAAAAASAAAPRTPPAAAIGFYGDGVLEAAIATGERLAVDAVPLVAEVSPGMWAGRWAVTMAEAAAVALSRGKSAILAVPDYRDQEQLAAALAAVLPAESIVRLDARQSNPDRYRAFLRCLENEPLAIIGNRSVLYAPAARLGLIAVWDDGDPLHGEPLAPYVATRDAALLRQEQQSSALMFFGHARSTEVERLVELGWLRSVSPRPSILPKIIPTMQQSSEDRLAAQARIPSSAWREARTALETGPVLVQVARPGYAPRLACVDCGQSARCLRCEGPLGQRSARSVPACAWCGALAADWHCTNCDGTKLRFVGAGATRTAEDLGRAFPGVRIILADGERQVLAVGSEPALVIATRGAEPIAAGGYRAVLLLDGDRMVARESLRVGEDCLRWWSNAVALAARGAPTILVGVGGTLASALSTWRLADYARSELADRRRLRFPPAVRVATLTGTVDAVSKAVESLDTVDVPRDDILGPVEAAQGTVRTIVRFEYGAGTAVAATLRSELVRSATSRRRSLAGKGIAGSTPGAPPPGLRVRFDDVEPFDDF